MTLDRWLTDSTICNDRRSRGPSADGLRLGLRPEDAPLDPPKRRMRRARASSKEQLRRIGTCTKRARSVQSQACGTVVRHDRCSTSTQILRSHSPRDSNTKAARSRREQTAGDQAVGPGRSRAATRRSSSLACTAGLHSLSAGNTHHPLDSRAKGEGFVSTRMHLISRRMQRSVLAHVCPCGRSAGRRLHEFLHELLHGSLHDPILHVGTAQGNWTE